MNKERVEQLIESFERKKKSVTPPKTRSDVYLLDMLKSDLKVLRKKLKEFK